MFCKLVSKPVNKNVLIRHAVQEAGIIHNSKTVEAIERMVMIVRNKFYLVQTQEEVQQQQQQPASVCGTLRTVVRVRFAVVFFMSVGLLVLIPINLVGKYKRHFVSVQKKFATTLENSGNAYA
jgi:hypothetical protein